MSNELLHFSLQGVEYISVMSSGGHLRGSRRYEDGWFYGYATLEATKASHFRIHELKPAPRPGPGNHAGSMARHRHPPLAFPVHPQAQFPLGIT